MKRVLIFLCFFLGIITNQIAIASEDFVFCNAAGQLEEYGDTDGTIHYRFSYDAKGRIETVEDLLHQRTTTRAYNEFGCVVTEDLGNGLSITSEYDSQGRCSLQILPDQSTIEYQYNTLFLESVIHTASDGQQSIQTYEHAPEGNVSTVFLDGDADTASVPSMWEKIYSFGSSIINTLSTLKDQISYSNYIEQDLHNISHAVFDANFLNFSGFQKAENAQSGQSLDTQDIHKNVRLTFINGILNMKEHFDQTIQQISKTHGGNTVHWIFKPTEGWTRDLFNSLFAKVGIVNRQAELLAETWKKLIEEMGGVEGSGMIFHFAHSIGAADTYIAKNLLTPEEQRMIHVITLGSPSLITNHAGFGSVINYVSKRDGVCYFDPVGYAKGLLSLQDNVYFLGSYWGIPFIDHTLFMETYAKVIEQLGKEFCEL